jgi:hypothetical protein
MVSLMHNKYRQNSACRFLTYTAILTIAGDFASISAAGVASQKKLPAKIC